MSPSGTPPPPREVSVSARAVRRGRAATWGRAFLDFAAVPVLVLLGFGLLAAVSIVADQTGSVALLNGIRAAAGHLVGRKAASTTLQAVATGLVTVASITFSVLLLAVQQTASNLSPVVFDQFIRRRTNQAFLAFFVGLAMFAYVVMAAVQDPTPPIVGATLATVLTVGALLILLALVYSTVDQMRPTSVLRVIHDRTLRAREEETALIRATRRESTSVHPVAARYRVHVTGYLTGLDLGHLERALDRAGDAEIELHVTLGDHLSYGDVVADVRGDDVDHAEAIAAQVAAALRVSRRRDLAHDPTTGIDELGNIAWTSGSTSKQNPEVAREALYALADLTARWMTDDPARVGIGSAVQPLPIVYRDNDLDRIVDVLYSLLVVAHESHQDKLAAAVLDAYRALIARADGELRERLVDDVGTAARLLDQMPPSPALRRARQAIDDATDGATDGGTDGGTRPVRGRRTGPG